MFAFCGIAATALTDGAIVSSTALPAAAQDGDRLHQRPRVEISRDQADSTGRDDHSNRSLNNEWVEITNTTPDAIDLRGRTLRDSDGNRYRFDNVRLASRATIRIHTGNGRDTRTDLFQDRCGSDCQPGAGRWWNGELEHGCDHRYVLRHSCVIDGFVICEARHNFAMSTRLGARGGVGRDRHGPGTPAVCRGPAMPT
ncbi:lamin tail domain-containing protein [Streptomyces sp. NPDC085540]|uniref:lamin tail domain-containing protein n=1 Tax=Streptomyces sp. NPDC085540 TaxID=3365730 RepID=UPI0037D4AC89